MSIIKKVLCIVLVLLLCFTNTINYVVLAQEITESPSPSPTPEEVVIDNTAVVIDEVASNANTGENSIEVVEPSPTPSASPEAIVEVIESSTPTPTPTSEITTSDSVSIVEVENNVNSNVVNSEYIYHTLNIYLPETGDIDLSQLTTNVLKKVYEQDQNLNETVNLKVTTIDNFAYVENTVVSDANSGGNSIEGSGNSEITTGNSYSAVSVLNNINTNIVDSKIHLVTINIYDSLNGNIILPEFQDNDSCSNCVSNHVLSNNAVVNNQVNSTANTGSNNIITSTSNSSLTSTSEIQTGNAQSVVNVLNLVNTNFINVIFKYFYINTLGVWVGDFLGWMDEGANTNDNIAINSSAPNSSGNTSSCTNCSSGTIGGTNVAVLSNNISSSSNTGNNNIESNDGNSNIKTGNAYSSVSLVNFVNSNLINSQGFIGFVNIFGSLVGDVGGTSVFTEDVTPKASSEPVVEEQQQTQFQRETGGIIEVTHTNNVGTHVLPGDTVTFFAKAKNVGLGKIYNVKLTIELFKDGKSYGGSDFNLGDINAQKAVKLTTGLVMSKKALSGKYTAKVTATGIIGPDNTEISASSQSEFKILGFNTALTNTNFPATVEASGETPPQVLGATNEVTDPLLNKMIVIFTSLLLLYLIAKGIQKREVIINYAYRIGTLLT